MTSVALVFLALLTWKVSLGSSRHVYREGSNMSPHVLHQTKLACDRIFFRRNATLKNTHLAGLLMHDDQEEITARKQHTFRLLRLQPIKNVLMHINGKYSSRHLIGSRFIILDLQNVDDDPDHIIEERSFRESRTWLSACVLQLKFGDGGILRVDIRVCCTVIADPVRNLSNSLSKRFLSHKIRHNQIQPREVRYQQMGREGVSGRCFTGVASHHQNENITDQNRQHHHCDVSFFETMLDSIAC
ncbi:uncharacterized protein LOC119132758 [Syngnathus acus]|uniref:uncharacterized protein LOC119132758 n=1 Tax=Syngnathus acus TaxID=161584 RepID=UPI0018863432|nr:uncharacterized protein LOC119132758 [Syngnathus acus]